MQVSGGWWFLDTNALLSGTFFAEVKSAEVDEYGVQPENDARITNRVFPYVHNTKLSHFYQQYIFLISA